MSPFEPLEVAGRGPIHFMGIGGAGMAPLAEIFLLAGARVTGCDLHPGPAAEALRGAGATVCAGHDPSHVEGCAALVVTAAVPQDHPEVAAARARGIPVLKRAEALGAVVNRGTVVGIAGTHGKTTTTTLTTTVLAAAGMDPTGVVGGRVPSWGGNLRQGSDRLYVVEADEYDRSFLTLRPSVALVTTLEADHLDIYGSLAAIEDAFHAFVDAVPADGMVAGCADDHGAGRLLARVGGAERSVVSYGLSAGSVLRAEDVRPAAGETRFTVRERGVRLGEARLRVPGLHNVRNALAAVAVARHLGAEWGAVAEGLASYAGVDRRFERVGEAGGVRFVDDYAHHPTEIAATLEAARSAHPEARIVAVFQPHLYSRTRDFAGEFGRALAGADRVFVTDVYAAREAPVPGVTGEMVAEAARAAGAEVRYLPERGGVAAAVAAELEPGDVCLTLGAGDLDGAAREMLELVGGAASPA
ncbi:MAG TPA: UDP-N-acetylmuramate--L-alanine ligase [Longimicrobiaceae bacterium]|nr:UDP-N-acetylmuramate--L-alanine ligase [Longimicrobiaceae bacterium]